MLRNDAQFVEYAVETFGDERSSDAAQDLLGFGTIMTWEIFQSFGKWRNSIEDISERHQVFFWNFL